MKTFLTLFVLLVIGMSTNVYSEKNFSSYACQTIILDECRRSSWKCFNAEDKSSCEKEAMRECLKESKKYQNCLTKSEEQNKRSPQKLVCSDF